MRQAWEEFFSARKAGESEPGPLTSRSEDPKLLGVRARHEAELLQYPNVVGVDVGIRMHEGKPTGEPCLVVYVQSKVPRAQLAKSDVLPRKIEGVLVDVVAVGAIEPMIR